MGNLRLYGSTSGYVEIAPPAVGTNNILTLPTDSIKSGLVLVNETTFSAVSSVSLNNVFSSTYDNYRIVTDLVGSAAGDVNIKFRTNGTDNSNASYKRQQITSSYADSAGGSGGTGSTFFYYDNFTGTSQRHGCFIDFYLPNNTAYTTWFGSVIQINSAGVRAGWFDATTVFDGFSLLFASGTLSGSVRVYGYRNSL